MTLTAKEFLEVLLQLRNCCLKHDDVSDALLTGIDHVEAYQEGENEGLHELALFRLRDSRWCVLDSWRDYTGHG